MDSRSSRTVTIIATLTFACALSPIVGADTLNVPGDYTAIQEAIDAAVVGDEISTVVFGHFNAFPIMEDPTKPNRGALSWVDRTPAELFGDVRAAWPDALLQVNHTSPKRKF